jgi:carotenoid 1,2-hydratase
MKPGFDLPVAPGGYAWWYLDALSDDGKHGLTVIAFVGSVFSPYYAAARRRAKTPVPGLANPLNHCALNVALYATSGGNGPTAWTMTERAAQAVQRSARTLRIGPSALEWDGTSLAVHIDEVTVPWPSRLRGSVRLYPLATLEANHSLDATGRHIWSPIAPCARVDVQLAEPRLCWRGTAYLDSNRGERPLEQDFSHWEWSRAVLTDQRCAVLYDVTRSDGSPLSLALEFGAPGGTRPFAAPPHVALPATRWQLPRRTRSDNPVATRVEQTLEDGPFYARSLLQTRLLGEQAQAVHESLSLRRWAQPVVQLMLPFRMPRRS